MGSLSRQKGKRGERQWRDELRENGYAARRGQQFAGGADSPDVICDALPMVHFEVKVGAAIRVMAAMEQARRDAGATRTGQSKIPIVAHRQDRQGWLVTMDSATFFAVLRDGQEGLSIAQKFPDFKCPQCGGSHFSRDTTTASDDSGAITVLDTVRCHDQFEKDCQWRGKWAQGGPDGKAENVTWQFDLSGKTENNNTEKT